MLRLFRIFLLTTSLIFGVVSFVSAAGPDGFYGLDKTALNSKYIEEGKAPSTVYSVVSSVVGTLLAILAIIFFILTTYAGLRWMTARGNEELATQAQQTLEAAVIGLVIVVTSYALTRFIFGALDKAPAETLPPLGCAAYIADETACRAAPEGCTYDSGTKDCFKSVRGFEEIPSAGVCLRAHNGEVAECAPMDKAACDAKGGLYQFYEGASQSFCDEQMKFKAGWENATDCCVSQTVSGLCQQPSVSRTCSSGYLYQSGGCAASCQ